MKKYLILLFLIVFVVVMFIVISIYRKMSFNSVLDNTINVKDKINYTTNIELTSTFTGGSMKIEYESSKYSDIRKVTINNYINDELENSLLKYVQGNKTYVYDNGDYEERETTNDDFKVNYKFLKDKVQSVKSKSGNKYIIKMNKVDAYNMIYDKEVLPKDKVEGTTDVTILVDEKNNFIEEISYEIKDLNIYNNESNLSDYKVKITNSNINNNDEIKLPVEKSE